MTEDEAKAKWCPHARTKTLAFSHDNSGPAGVNRDIDGEPVDHLHTCLASACMAWRTITRTEVRHRDGHVVRHGEIYLRGNATEHEVLDGGYCGLAGAQP